MVKLVDQISIGCAVNSAIINDAMRKKEFVESCVDVPLQYNILPPESGAPWPFKNTSWEAYKLYCMVVVPKELYNLPENDEFYQSLIAKDVFRGFISHKEKKSFSESPIYYFSSLRNSISHVNYCINDSCGFEFWDHPPKKSEVCHWHWHVTVSKKDMDIFLDEIAEAVFKIYNETRQGLRDPNTYKKL